MSGWRGLALLHARRNNSRAALCAIAMRRAR